MLDNFEEFDEENMPSAAYHRAYISSHQETSDEETKDVFYDAIDAETAELVQFYDRIFQKRPKPPIEKKPTAKWFW